MTSGLAISAFMPSIISSSVFSTRRANNGVDAIASNNPYVGVMNMDIAGGQILNAAKGVSSIAKTSDTNLAASITSAEESIKAMSKGDKFLSGFGKVLNFTADHINPIICATGAVKVACAEDKKEAAISEGLALGTMLAAEGAAKQIIGMPKIEKVDGKKVVITRDGLYKKNPFLEKQTAALKDYCQTAKICDKSLKFLPGTLKGIGFACSSIGGYCLGLKLADKIITD